MSSNTKIERPPENAKRVYRWADLPNKTKGAWYRVTDPGQEPRKVYVKNHKQQVLEGLMIYPVYSASYCRVSDQVSPLRHEDGVDIHCEMYRNDQETGRERYGVYFLRSKVERIDAGNGQ